MAVVTWNPADKNADLTLSEGNLRGTGAIGAIVAARATESKAADKWYWEIKYVVFNGSREHGYGIATSAHALSAYPGITVGATVGYGYYEDGRKINNGGFSAYGDSFTTNDIIGIAIDLTAGKIWFAKNNVWQAAGNPAAGTNPAFTGLSGTYFPFMAIDYIASAKARFAEADFSYSPPSGYGTLEGGGAATGTNFFDGKLQINDTAADDSFDGKVKVDIFAVNTFNGKVTVNDTIAKLFNGKVEVIGCKADLLDGKVEVVGWEADLLDGKINVANLSSTLFNGCIKVYNIDTDLLDGKAKIQGEVVTLIDGKVSVESLSTTLLLDGKVDVRGIYVNLLDGKLWIKEAISGSINLPSLDILGNTGAAGDVVFPFFEVLGEVSVGVSAQGDITLPGLGVASLTGARCKYDLPSLGVSGESVVGILASGKIVLPIFNIDGQAFTDAIVDGVVTLPTLTIHASSISGALCVGEVLLPTLGISATAKVGIISVGAVTLPCLVIEGEGGHIPTGDGDVVLPLLQIYSTASILADPRDGCHILRHHRWR